MLGMVLILILITIALMGDIIWDFLADGWWWFCLWARGSKLNFDKRRRPQRHHYKHY